jgi:hypothetical protein
MKIRLAFDITLRELVIAVPLTQSSQYLDMDCDSMIIDKQGKRYYQPNIALVTVSVEKKSHR